MTSWDVVVVGARVAGAATAMLLAREGLRVLCVDRSRYGSDTLSTHALMRGGVLQLQRWGLLDAVAGLGHARRCGGRSSTTAPTRSASRSSPAAGVDAAVRPAPHRARRRCWSTPRRQAGASVEFSAPVVGLLRDRRRHDVTGVVAADRRGRSTRVERAGLVVGADGRDSHGRGRGAGPDPGQRPARRRLLLRLLGRPARRRLRVVLLARGDRRPDPDQRRPHLPVRRRRTGARPGTTA